MIHGDNLFGKLVKTFFFFSLETSISHICSYRAFSMYVVVIIIMLILHQHEAMPFFVSYLLYVCIIYYLMWENIKALTGHEICKSYLSFSYLSRYIFKQNKILKIPLIGVCLI